MKLLELFGLSVQCWLIIAICIAILRNLFWQHFWDYFKSLERNSTTQHRFSLSNNSCVNRFNELGSNKVKIQIYQSVFFSDPLSIAKNVNSPLINVSCFRICFQTTKFGNNVIMCVHQLQFQKLLTQYYLILQSGVKKRLKKALNTISHVILLLRDNFGKMKFHHVILLLRDNFGKVKFHQMYAKDVFQVFMCMFFQFNNFYGSRVTLYFLFQWTRRCLKPPMSCQIF